MLFMIPFKMERIFTYLTNAQLDEKSHRTVKHTQYTEFVGLSIYYLL